jgi:hypothetical protein
LWRGRLAREKTTLDELAADGAMAGGPAEREFEGIRLATDGFLEAVQLRE